MERLFSNKKIIKPRQDINGYYCGFCDISCGNSCIVYCGGNCTGTCYGGCTSNLFLPLDWA
jgi:ribosomally synthesized peptide (Cys-rich family)